MNVAVASVVPAAAVNVTGTPVFQFALVNAIVAGALVMAVLPAVRAIATLTVPVGAADSRIVDEIRDNGLDPPKVALGVHEMEFEPCVIVLKE